MHRMMWAAGFGRQRTQQVSTWMDKVISSLVPPPASSPTSPPVNLVAVILPADGPAGEWRGRRLALNDTT